MIDEKLIFMETVVETFEEISIVRTDVLVLCGVLWYGVHHVEEFDEQMEF